MPKGTVVAILAAQKARLNARELLQHAYSQEPAEKAAMFKIIAEIADASIVPELLSRLEGKDPIARTHIINILARFNQPEVAQALQRAAQGHEQVRAPGRAQRARPASGGNVDVGLLCEVLRDPDVETQQKAIDAVVRANHPGHDPAPGRASCATRTKSARRAAVEVLNEIGTPQHIKHLLQSIKDDDWWVRSRAADALAKIGGPRVIEAALELIRDQDEDVRRAAIEILNQTKDERAVNFLIEATRDTGLVGARARRRRARRDRQQARAARARWRCCDAADDRSMPTVVRAIGKLGDASHGPEADAAARAASRRRSGSR